MVRIGQSCGFRWGSAPSSYRCGYREARSATHGDDAVVLALREQRSCYFFAVPLLRILALVVALTNMVGLADIVLSDACEEMCKDDGCDKDCPPGMACHCHSASAVPSVGTVQLVGTIDTPELVEACSDEQQAHASPDPREILRVPIAAV